MPTPAAGRWESYSGCMIGPHGEKRPDNPIANAVLVARLVTGEAEEQYVEHASRSGGRQGQRRGSDGRTLERQSPDGRLP